MRITKTLRERDQGIFRWTRPLIMLVVAGASRSLCRFRSLSASSLYRYGWWRLAISCRLLSTSALILEKLFRAKEHKSVLKTHKSLPGMLIGRVKNLLTTGSRGLTCTANPNGSWPYLVLVRSFSGQSHRSSFLLCPTSMVAKNSSSWARSSLLAFIFGCGWLEVTSWSSLCVLFVA